MQALDITSAQDSIQGKIKSFKTYIDVSGAAKSLKNAGDSATKASSQITSQLDKIKNLQKRFFREPPNSMDQLLGFLGQTQGTGSGTSTYIRKKMLEAAALIEPKLSVIIKEETINALGGSIEQTYNGISPSVLESQPLPLLPQQEGIYIPVSSIDLFSNLKQSPETNFGKIFYEAQ